MTIPTFKTDLAALSPTYSIWKVEPAHSSRAFFLVRGHEPTIDFEGPPGRPAQVGAPFRSLLNILTDLGEETQALVPSRTRTSGQTPSTLVRIKRGSRLDLYKVKGGVPNTTMFLAPPGIAQDRDTLLAAYRRTAMPPDSAWAVFRLIEGKEG